MKNSNTLTILLAAIVMTSVLTGCGNVPGDTTQAPSEELLSEKTSSSDTIAPSESEETTVPPTIDVNEALTNVWRIVENDCVEEIPILPGLLLDDIKDWMKTTEYKEIKLYQRTDWNKVRLAVYGDMAVAQMSMIGEDLVWNVRMEKSDKRENKTSIDIPVTANTYIIPSGNGMHEEECFEWNSMDGTRTELYLVYFEETQNLYTFYAHDNRTMFENSRSPSVVLNEIIGESLDMYRYPNHDEIVASKGKEDIRYFRIKMFDDVRTYQYRFGDTVQQWVNSKYNTDGWHIVHKDGIPYAVSADNKFRLDTSQYIWRVLNAGLNGMPKN